MTSKKVVTVVGTRPQFVKLAPVASVLDKAFVHVVVHTGQHYDDAMSRAFFEGLVLPQPHHHLGAGSGTQAVQTGVIMARLEGVLITERPDLVLVYGDTNSTIAGALTAAKLNIPVAHVEAGLRSFNRAMPEEINRIVTDRVARLLFCPTEAARENLKREGRAEETYLVGDVMLDAFMAHRTRIDHHRRVLQILSVREGGYYLATVHRASNTDRPEHLARILGALSELDAPVLFPLHPRTRDVMNSHNIPERRVSNVVFVDPVGYLDMLALESAARKIVTDSGGVQKEAYFLGVPCVTLREETEWVETLEGGWNTLVGTNPARIVAAVSSPPPRTPRGEHYGDGRASEKISAIITQYLG